MCYLSECPILPTVIAHGFVNGSGSLEGARYEFSCESGYSLIGDNQVVCTDAGVWNGSLPTCLIGEKKKPNSLLQRYLFQPSQTH